MALNKKVLRIFLILLILLAVFFLGIMAGRETVPSEKQIIGVIKKDVGKPIGVDFSLFWDTWKTIEDKYVYKEKIDYQNMIYGAVSGLVKSLDDPYSNFFTPADTKRFYEDVKGSFEGVGIEIGFRKGVLTVISPLKGTPAEKAGLRAGDQILKVDDTLTVDLTLDQAVDLIRGPKGTEVALTILRKDEEKTRDVRVIRGIIEIPTLDWKIIEGDIAHVQLYNFTEKSPRVFQETVTEILKSRADRIILDLRNNPGGLLEASVEIASWFLEKNTLVVIEDFGGTQKNEEYFTIGNPKLIDFPLVVLINQGSASASEILAGALRDGRDIKLIGEKTFGKGSIQSLEDLRGGASIKLTIAKWLTPSGRSISEEGLEPDIEIELTEEDFEADRDPQLEKAIEIIREL